ncbi:MAG: pyridoxal-phosphate dependent enzyme [Alphaproteobacteria bacterium]|nr:MAG: pyridoxal-phosphate dependent enzyme [Alphaproteobacteria bacterium]
MKQHAPGVLQLIGNTPMIEVTRIDTGPCQLFLKLESQNPGGSIKDRIARTMIEAAEKDGRLKPGGTIVEATAGNTGLGLALIGVLKGYKIILIVPDKMSREKIFHCKALGADVRVTRSDVNKGHPEYYQDMAQRIANEVGGFYVNQFGNPANPLAHEISTAPEIWEQMQHDVDAIVCGVGSGGTMAGIARFMSRVSPNTEMVLADPVGSILAPLVNTGKMTPPGSWLVEGIGEDFVPGILDVKVMKKAYAIPDEESLATARQLLKNEGILAGPSSGTLIAAALRYCREQKTPKRVVSFVCDRGDKYLSKTFSDFWMTEQGFTPRKPTGTIEDLIVRRHDSGDTVVVRKSDTLQTAYKRMRFADVSQLPVLDDAGKLVGLVDEKMLLEGLSADGKVISLATPVSEVMREAKPQLPKQTPIADASALMRQHPLVMVTDDGKLLGLITRVDMLNHLYLKGHAA